MPQADIGVMGLAVMGQNLVLNMADHGFAVSVYNRSRETTEDFIARWVEHRSVVGYDDLEGFVASLQSPRKVMLMVKAGDAVDAMIAQLLGLLESGDIIIDGGNSLYSDTTRRVKALSERGLHFVGSGVSGGEEGARHGPSMMPGGDVGAWEQVRPIFQAISAKVDGEPCCDWVGPEGSGHYVKMVHNGIEYGDMQLIAEAYWLLRYGVGLDVAECAEVFARWNEGVLDSYLIEITAHILTFKDSDGSPLIDKIRDNAGQKGTGKWTGISALELGVPLSLITESVYARCLSSLVRQEGKALHVSLPSGERNAMIDAIRGALYASKIISYTQGYMLLREAAKHYGWALNYGGIALMWRGGCIIRSRFLGEIRRAYTQNPALEHLLHDAFFASALSEAEASWRRAVVFAIDSALPIPAMSSALAFYDGLHSPRLPTALVQAQRDYFGAHGYGRIDADASETFHTDWIGSGGLARSGSYEV
ncbi:MAG: decarboxylating NADP(+)-dependent phosphogluconate dehydrogenase [Campylobacterales bacterium]|nr:decarboxylating NADP(+)-dependent phosphogluconate dehydrogenase [Campylobacterales bacterium]